MYETSFVDGKAVGKHVIYYDNGGVKWEGNVKKGKKEGIWSDYDEEGNITDEDIWKEGVCGYV